MKRFAIVDGLNVIGTTTSRMLAKQTCDALNAKNGGKLWVKDLRGRMDCHPRPSIERHFKS